MKDVRLGKLEPKLDRRNLQLASYLEPALPVLPPHVTRHRLIHAWPMYANDRLGDCTCAAAGHIVQLVSRAAGHATTPSDAAVLDLYWRTGSADDGRYCLDVLNTWRAAGLGEDRLRAFVEIDPTSVEHIKLAVYLFGAAYVGIALPENAQGRPRWALHRGAGSEPGSWGGHCVPIVDYDAHGCRVVTWGGTLRMTWPFWREYGDEAYAVLDPTWLRSTGESVPGFSLSALDTDLAALRRR